MTRKHGCQRTSLTASADSTLCMCWRSAALRVEVLANDVQVRNIARQHSIERGPATKDGSLVRTADPLVCRARVRQKELERFIDTENVGNPLERIARQAHLGFLAPFEVSGLGRQSEQGQLFGNR